MTPSSGSVERLPEGNTYCHGQLRPALGYLRASARLDRARAALGQPPTIEPAPLAVEDFLKRFDRTPAAATCERCGARLRFVPLIAHGPAPPPTLH